MKILHILDEYRIHPYSVINYLKNNFPDMDQSFFITKSHDYVMKSNPYLLAFPDLIYELPIDTNNRKSRIQAARYLEKYLKAADVIIWHTTRSITTVEYLKTVTKSVYLNKSVWSIMSRDCIISVNRLGITAKKHIERRKQKYKKKLEQCRVIGLKNPSERDHVQEIFPNMCLLDTPLMDCSYQLALLEEEEYQINKKNEVPTVWVGYNAYKFNAHTDLIDGISSSSQYREFLTILPMNYALCSEYGSKPSPDYVLRIKNYAERNLTGRVIILNRRRVPDAAYFKTLNSADAVVLPSDRPEFFELLFDMLWLGKRVFFYSDVPLRQYLLDKGFCIHALEDFAETELIADSNEVEQNRRAIISMRESNKQKWQEFFDYLKEEVCK